MKISKLLRLFLTLGFPLLLVVAFVAVAQPAYAANPNVIFAQCANGSNGEDPTCTGSGNNGWVTGKVGPSKANYQVGDFIAYRGVHTNLIVGNNYCFGMWWDIAKDVLPAIDYLGSYDFTLPQADPTFGTALAGAAISDTETIPYDTALDGVLDGMPFAPPPPDQGVLTLWGGDELTVVGYSNTTGGELTNSSQSLEYCFTAGGTEAVLAWGGHIADPLDWSAPDRPPGSPYHMRTGTVSGYFTPPRTNISDLSSTSPDGAIVDHFTVGSQDLQLGITGQPTAITLSDVSANGIPTGTLTAVAGLVVAAILTLSVMAVARRQPVEEESRNR